MECIFITNGLEFLSCAANKQGQTKPLVAVIQRSIPFEPGDWFPIEDPPHHYTNEPSGKTKSYFSYEVANLVCFGVGKTVLRSKLLQGGGDDASLGTSPRSPDDPVRLPDVTVRAPVHPVRPPDVQSAARPSARLAHSYNFNSNPLVGHFVSTESLLLAFYACPRSPTSIQQEEGAQTIQVSSYLIWHSTLGDSSTRLGQFPNFAQGLISAYYDCPRSPNPIQQGKGVQTIQVPTYHIWHPTHEDSSTRFGQASNFAQRLYSAFYASPRSFIQIQGVMGAQTSHLDNCLIWLDIAITTSKRLGQVPNFFQRLLTPFGPDLEAQTHLPNSPSLKQIATMSSFHIRTKGRLHLTIHFPPLYGTSNYLHQQLHTLFGCSYDRWELLKNRHLHHSTKSSIFDHDRNLAVAHLLLAISFDYFSLEFSTCKAI